MSSPSGVPALPTPAGALMAQQDVDLDDLPLEQALEELRRIVLAEDPSNFLDGFILRLRDRVQRLTPNQLADFDQLYARLVESLQEPVSTAALMPIVESERSQYEKLLRHGGRPAYHIDLVERVCRNAHEYDHLVSPWLISQRLLEPPLVFMRQVASWSEFRAWQYRIRKRRTGYDFPSLTGACAEAIRRFNRTRADKSFASYAEAAGRVLRLYKIEIPFEPAADPTLQDPLTTWLEYIVCKYWLCKTLVDRISHHETLHDEAWEKLVTTGVVSLSETQLGRLDDDSTQSRWMYKKAQAESEIASAEAALQTLEERREAEPQLREARSRLDAAEISLLRIRGRIAKVGEFHKQTIVWRRHGVLWRMLAVRNMMEFPWIVQQLPEVVTESTAAGGQKRPASEQTSTATTTSEPVHKKNRVV